MATRRGQESKRYFKILIDGNEIPGFIKVQGLSYITKVIEKSGNEHKLPEKIPGHTSCSNIILYKKRTREQPFWNWLKDIRKGKVEKKDITIELIYRNKPLRGWKLINCWPCRWSVSDISDEVLNTIEEIEIVVEDIELL